RGRDAVAREIAVKGVGPALHLGAAGRDGGHRQENGGEPGQPGAAAMHDFLRGGAAKGGSCAARNGSLSLLDTPTGNVPKRTSGPRGRTIFLSRREKAAEFCGLRVLTTSAIP